MGLNYHNLDERTRAFMVAEIDFDIAGGTMYFGKRLNDKGVKEWVPLLREAVLFHSDTWLAGEVHSRGLLKIHEERRKPKGGTTIVQVPVNAHETLAEGEFNRFYVRGLCQRAIEDNILHVVAYRARYAENPRLESEIVIGKVFIPSNLLNDLRISQGVEPALGVPPGPNSGITVALP